MVQKFKYYLHDDSTREEMIVNMKNQGVDLPESVWKKLNRPFYEVTLNCLVDLNGKVVIESLE